MARSVTHHQAASTIVGSPEWFAESTRWVRNTLKSAAGECRPIAHKCPDLRQYALKRLGISWEEYCKTQLDADPEWVTSIERGVEILERSGHKGPVTPAVAVAATQSERAQELARKAVPLKEHGVNQHETAGVYNVKSSKVPEIKGGNRASYLSRRIARDAPEVLERMKAGEFPSVRAAAVEAGIIKIPSLVDQAHRLYVRMTPAERREFEGRLAATR